METSRTFSTQMGATTSALPVEVEAVMRQTHDKAIANAGPFRRGPVEWTLWEGDERFEMLDLAYDGFEGSPQDQATVDQLRAWCRDHPGGVLVVAQCEVDEEGSPS